jgi:hypothetical protein
MMVPFSATKFPAFPFWTASFAQIAANPFEIGVPCDPVTSFSERRLA